MTSKLNAANKMNPFNDPVSQWLMFAIAFVGIIAFHNLITPPKENKKTLLQNNMWEEYKRISRLISGAVNNAGLVGLSDEILDMRHDYRKVKGINNYTGRLHAKLLNREARLREEKKKSFT